MHAKYKFHCHSRDDSSNTLLISWKISKRNSEAQVIKARLCQMHAYKYELNLCVDTEVK